MLRVVFVDVGGTLWPNTWRSLPGDNDLRAARLGRTVPSLTHDQAAAIVARLAEIDHPPGERQATDAVVRAALDAVAPGSAIGVEQVVDAMCLPASGRAIPFPGARELLESLAVAARIVVVSNVLWRDREAQRRDFEAVGFAPFIAEYITSLDVGWRKPNAAFFDAALEAGGHPPEECALIGDSEANDIIPAVALGMFAVRLALEEPTPRTSAAQHVSDSLYDVRDVLMPLCTTDRGGTGTPQAGR